MMTIVSTTQTRFLDRERPEYDMSQTLCTGYKADSDGGIYYHLLCLDKGGLQSSIPSMPLWRETS